MGCIIIDANRGGEFNPPSQDAEPILKWVVAGKGVVIAGGKLKKELLACGFRKIYHTLMQSGRLFEIEGAKVDNEVNSIANNLASNDGHVIAIARLSDCRLLYSHDKDLQIDFKNKTLIDNPRGKIYSSCNNADLLQTCPKSIFQKK